jgi:hypothetical protein
VVVLNVRPLAAVDMYGTSGSARRRRLIRAEFIIGVVGCTLLGVLASCPAAAGRSRWRKTT